MKKIFGFMFCIVFYSYTLNGAENINPLNIYKSTAISISTYKKEIEKLPTLVQKDAAEFYEKMHRNLLKWATSDKDPNIKNWSVFFIYALFEKEMKFQDQKTDTKEIIHNIFTNKKRNGEESSLFSIFFEQEPQKSTVGSSGFYQHINKNKEFKNIRETNVYCQFISGFLNLVEAIQGKSENKQKEATILLVTSAYGLCNISLEVLKKIEKKIYLIENIEKNTVQLTRNNFIKIINSNSLFDYEQTFFFIKLTDIEKARMVFLMNNHYDRFVEYTYGRLAPNKQELYKSLSDSLRVKLIEKRNAASAFSAISSKLNLIIPFITGVLGGITTLYSAGDSDQKALLITSGTFSLLVPICSLAYGIHQWYYAIQTPTYVEKQVKLIGLYYALESRNETDTGDSIAQEIVDKLDKDYDHNKTLCQNTLVNEKERK